MFFVAERAADIAQVRVMRIDLYDRTAGVCVLWQAAQSTPLCLSENAVPAWIGAVTPMTNATAAQAANICFKIVSCFL